MSDASQPGALPLFYRDPQPLSAETHGAWRLKDGDVAFAADTPFAPLVVAEIAAAARDYPVVFSAGESAQPVAVLGLEQRNLFVENGRWADDAYVPAYVRRYPFGFVATVNPDGFILAVDAASDRLMRTGDEGAPLFDGDQPSPLTQDAMAFCRAFQGEAEATRAFGEALRAQGLLIDRRADAVLPDGRKLGLDGFQVIDTERLANLDEAVVVEWHRRGWLALANFHLASLERFNALLARQGRAGGAEPAPKPTKSKKA